MFMRCCDDDNDGEDGEDGGDDGEDEGDDNDGEGGEDDGKDEGDDKHDYLPTEDGARCPASLNTIQYRCPTCVLQYNKTCVLQCNTIQYSVLCVLQPLADALLKLRQYNAMQHSAMQYNLQNALRVQYSAMQCAFQCNKAQNAL